MTNSNNFSQKQQSLYAHYQSLPLFAKIVLQFCSIIVEPADISSILRCLYNCSINTGMNRQDYSLKIHPIVEQLKSLNLLTSTLECNTIIREIISREAVHDDTFADIAATVKQEFPLTGSKSNRKVASHVPFLREIRIDLYSGDIESFHQHLIDFHQKTSSEEHPLVSICNNPFSETWFSVLPDHVQLLALHEILKHSINKLENIDQITAYLSSSSDSHVKPPIERHNSFLYLFLAALLFKGNFSEVIKVIKNRASDTRSFGIDGWVKFVQGETHAAIDSFNNDLEQLHRINGTTQAYFTGFEGVICCLAHLKVLGPEEDASLNTITDSLQYIQPGSNFSFSYDILKQIVLSQNSPTNSFSYYEDTFGERTSIDDLIMALAAFWVESRLPSFLHERILKLYKSAKEANLEWLACEFAELLYKTTNQNHYKDYIHSFTNTNVQRVPLIETLSYELPWKRALKGLQNLSLSHSSSLPAKQTRLVWHLRTNAHNQIEEIIPKLQKISSDGQWRQGRTIALNNLHQLHEKTFITDQDKHVCATLKPVHSPKNTHRFTLDFDQAIIALVGHPLVFVLAPYPVQIDIIKRQPDLHIQQEKDGIQIFFLPFPEENQRVVALFETRNRLGVYSITPEVREITEIVGSHGLKAPVSEKNNFLHVLGKLANHCNIHTNFDTPNLSLEHIESDKKIYCQLSPSGTGFSAILLVKPYPTGTQYFSPGAGAQIIISKHSGKTIQIVRNLEREEKHALLVEEACPVLIGNEIGEWEWLLQNLEDCLLFLEQLQSLTDKIVVEWPKGKSLKIIKSVQTNQLMLKVKKSRNWFEVQGNLTLDEDTILSLNDLLTRFKQNRSNFIPLTENNYISLSNELRSYFEKIDSISWIENDTLRFAPNAAFLLLNSDFPQELIESDTHWQNLTEKISQANHYEPQLPSTLNAQLRLYQKSGYSWLERLAFMGFGACLADEMGLGKTIQALSFILNQSTQGPSLVIAPTSVCFNWIDEIIKFTPTLTPVSLLPHNRKKTVRKLSCHDVLITSYGLLQQEQELFSEINWQVIILDEAQAIKNMNTKRFKAALSLRGENKIVTTGTPLENNLGELWSIFRFINPGLLGPIGVFNKRYAGPIEKEGSVQAQKQLKKIISPFILRRLKTQVLDELPSRTEVNLQVQLSDEEQTLYESYRRKALDNIDSDPSIKKHLHIKILAEIMKLRRLCCNPNLIAPELSLKSSKLAVFDSLLIDLLSSGHKILVFSQFVDHLKILERHILSKNISYQYLDGSTTAVQRKKRVKAFQAGIGDVFLISLKAGGLGLNLTAANYVIHMDPWWNPAVEDQASDRAHRIGQKLPVTIYRLITQNTIEEKIVELHTHKRDLAENLLQGTDVSSKISSEQLLEILGQYS